MPDLRLARLEDGPEFNAVVQSRVDALDRESGQFQFMQMPNQLTECVGSEIPLVHVNVRALCLFEFLHCPQNPGRALRDRVTVVSLPVPARIIVCCQTQQTNEK